MFTSTADALECDDVIPYVDARKELLKHGTVARTNPMSHPGYIWVLGWEGDWQLLRCTPAAILTFLEY